MVYSNDSRRGEIPNDSGIVIVVTAMIILALVGVVAMLMHFAYLASVQTELQSAADAAALTAASRLNSGKSGWADAREAAVRSLNNSNVLSSVGAEQKITLSLDQELSTWDLTDSQNLLVSVERGLWIPGDGAAPPSFTSYEGEWQEDNPGIPRHVAANAVHVLVRRPKTRIFGSPFGGVPEYSIEASSISLRGPPDSVCVAPFAIPVCTLLSADGEFQGASGDEICYGERVIARADRYCREDTESENCKTQTFPSSQYNTVSPLSGDRNPYVYGQSFYTEDLEAAFIGEYHQPFTKEGFSRLAISPEETITMPFPTQDHGLNYFNWNDYSPESSSWNGQRLYSTLSDNFAVYGLPYADVNSDGLESSIETLLAKGTSQACVKAHIGDPFAVSDEGLVNPAVGDALWNIINNGGQGISDSGTLNHVRYSSTMLGSLGHLESFYLAVQNYDGSKKVPLYEVPVSGDMRFKGVCNTRRGKYIGIPPFLNPSHFNPGEFGSRYYFKAFPGISDASPVWKVKVPVIAEPGPSVAACQGVNPGVLTDPSVRGSKNYIIIGFVELIVYDVDIGQPPPDYAIERFDNVGTMPFEPSWRFQEPCNNVRSRISCESKFIPSSSPDGYSNPRLVTGVEKAHREPISSHKPL